LLLVRRDHLRIGIFDNGGGVGLAGLTMGLITGLAAGGFCWLSMGQCIWKEVGKDVQGGDMSGGQEVLYVSKANVHWQG
jgi:hypothetical protein